MRKLTYPAVFEPNGKGGYGVYFPDLPGCATVGDDFESAQANAVEVLELHLYGMEKDGDTIPAPSKNPVAYPETESGYFLSFVTIYPDIVKNEMDNRRVRTNITIPYWLKEAAEDKGVNYSRLLETALIDYLGIAR